MLSARLGLAAAPLRSALAALLLSVAAGVAEAGSLRLVGEARLEFLFWSVYESRLFSADGRYREGQRPLRLEIEYLVPVRSGELVARTGEEWRRQGREHHSQRAWLDRLRRLWPDVSAGDVLALEVAVDGASTFFHNGERLGRIGEPAFAEHFLGIWLAADTSRPGLRRQLLGAH